MSFARIYICTVYFAAVVILCRRIVVSGEPCFGYGCFFPCHCKQQAVCNRNTGHCDNGCATGAVNIPWRGPGCQIGNIAYMKLARQSSTLDSPRTDASKAVDGILTGSADANYMHTHNIHPHPWWELNLGALHYIYNMTMFNRIHEDAYKWNTMFYVFVGNKSNPGHLCNNYTGTVPRYVPATFLCIGGPVIAQYVRIAKYGGVLQPKVLNFSELVIVGFLKFACGTGKFGITCGEECGRCLNKSCNQLDGVCPKGCELWFLGHRCDLYIDIPRYQPASEDGRANIIAVFTNASAVGISFRGIDSLKASLAAYYYYVVQYSTGTSGNWQNSVEVKHIEQLNQSALINNLNFNTWYNFRIVPHRQHLGKTEAGIPSEISDFVKTKCTAPEKPNITGYESCKADLNYIILISFQVHGFSGCDSITSVKATCQSGTEAVHVVLDLTTQNVYLNPRQIAFTVSNQTSYHITVEVFNNENQKNQISIDYLISEPQPCLPGEMLPRTNSSSVEPTSEISSTPVFTASGYQAGLIVGTSLSSVVAVVAIIIIIVLLVMRSRQTSRRSDKHAENTENIDLRPGVIDNLGASAGTNSLQDNSEYVNNLQEVSKPAENEYESLDNRKK